MVTQPEQAQIYVNGKLHPTLSPATVELASGARLRIVRKGFKPLEVTHTAGRPLPKLELEPVIGLYKTAHGLAHFAFTAQSPQGAAHTIALFEQMDDAVRGEKAAGPGDKYRTVSDGHG